MSSLSDITVQKVVSGEYGIVLTANGITEEYSLDQLPPAKSQLVAAGKEQILQKLSLNPLISGLKHSSRLMVVQVSTLAHLLS